MHAQAPSTSSLRSTLCLLTGLCLLAGLSAASGAALAQDPETAPAAPAALSSGPMLGALTATGARVWARAGAPGEVWLKYRGKEQAQPRTLRATAAAENDLCVVFELEGLQPATAYRYRIGAGEELRTRPFTFTTPAAAPARVRLAFGSCADDRRFPSQPIWTRMQEAGAETVVMLGDMPYIDSTDIEVQQERYRAFYAVPELRELMPTVPFYATWDDHDFGRNDTNGKLPEKAGAKVAFDRYHANPSSGAGTAGIYTSFRSGPVEVFLLDTRWFAATEPSPFDPDKTTLLGKDQWAWLKKGLEGSTAPFKILACGMIWNGSTRPFKTDHWMTYPHERAALFEFIGEAKIEGALLVGGDIHRSRALRHDTEKSAGYALTELITSPVANFVIEAANAPHPGLLKDMGVDQTFLLVEAETTEGKSVLKATFVDVLGEALFELTLQSEDLAVR